MNPKMILSILALFLSFASFGIAPITGTSNVCVGSTRTLSDSTSGGTWISSNPTIASTNPTSGVVSGISAGIATITYYVSSTSYATYSFTVNPVPAPITGTTSVAVGSTTALSDPAPGGTWVSGSSSVATVNIATGLVTGVSAGTAGIYYVLTTGCGVYTPVTVSSSGALPPIGGTASDCIGGTRTLTDSVTGGSWTSSNPGVATINLTSGVVTGIAAGTATITFSHGGSFVTRLFTVISGPAPIAGTTTLAAGTTTTLTDATAGGTWTSSNTSVATVNISTGVVTGVAAGTATIYYVLTSGCGVYTIVHVTSSSSLPPIDGTASACIGSTRTLTDSVTGGSWSSSNPAVATINPTSGVVTGVAAGTSTITYTHGGGFVTRLFTVISGPAPIAGTTTLATGTTTTLTDATAGGTWTSSNTSVATVNISTGVVTGVAAGTATIYYVLTSGCGVYTIVHVTSSSPLPPIGGTASVCIGGTRTLTDSVTGGSWTSSNPGVATINLTSGVVTGIAAGTATITFSHGGSFVTRLFTVISGPAPIAGTTTLATGTTTTLTDATAGGTWTSSNTSVATVNISTGVVTGVAAGTATIYYVLTSGCGVYTIVHVTSSSSLPPIDGTASACIGSTRTLTDSVTGGSWSSSNLAVATINPTSGVVTGIAAGTSTITYTHSGTFVTITFTVNPLPAPITGSDNICSGAMVALSDPTSGGTWSSGNPSIATVTSTGVVTGAASGIVNIYYSVGGCGTYHTVTVNATAMISGGSDLCMGSTTLLTLTATPPGGTWISSNTSVAIVGSTGSVAAVGPGTANIYYSIGGCSASHTVTINAAASITGGSTICSGSTATLMLIGTPTGGTWTSSSTTIATVGSAGAVTAVGTGVVNIYYSIGGCYAYHTVTVNAAATITGGNTICLGSAATLSLSASPAGGTWSSSSVSVATVSSTGAVTAVGAGTANIYYTIGGCYSEHTVTVNHATTISGGSTVCAGATTALSLTGSPAGGTWTSSSAAIATVSSAGVVTAVGPGIVNIYYSAGGCYAYHTVTVNAAASISGSSSICAGATETLVASPSGGTWTSSSTSIATVSLTGLVTALAPGTVNIYYLSGGCYSHRVVTVNPHPGITATATPVSCGYTYTLTATGASTYSWLPITGLSCATCATTSVNVTATTTYTVTGTTSAGCSSTASVVADGNRIIGYINFSSTPPDSLEMKVWLIRYSPTDSTLTALDSAYTCLSTGSTTPRYQFTDKPAGTYLVKAKVLHSGAVGTSGYIPTYGHSSSHWYAATTIAHTAATDYSSITMLYGTVPSGPGFIGGTVSSGAGRGTTDFIPVSGMLVQLLDATTNDVLTYAYTDATGAYSFPNLVDGNYIVFPEEYAYYTTQSAIINLNSSSESVTNIDFKQLTLSRTITPYTMEGVKTVVSQNGVSVYPNPTSNTVNVKWGNQTMGSAEIVITDVVGREVFRSSIDLSAPAGKAPINPDLKNGIYLLTIKSESIYYTSKLQIQR